jgi:hypothetical protein
VCGQAIIYASMGAESVRGVAEHPLGLRHLCSDSYEDGSPYLEYAFHESDGSAVRRVVWVRSIGFVYQCRSANAIFVMRVAMFGHCL